MSSENNKSEWGLENKIVAGVSGGLTGFFSYCSLSKLLLAHNLSVLEQPLSEATKEVIEGNLAVGLAYGIIAGVAAATTTYFASRKD